MQQKFFFFAQERKVMDVVTTPELFFGRLFNRAPEPTQSPLQSNVTRLLLQATHSAHHNFNIRQAILAAQILSGLTDADKSLQKL